MCVRDLFKSVFPSFYQNDFYAKHGKLKSFGYFIFLVLLAAALSTGVFVLNFNTAVENLDWGRMIDDSIERYVAFWGMNNVNLFSSTVFLGIFG
jgi:hypothetical protein